MWFFFVRRSEMIGKMVLVVVYLATTTTIITAIFYYNTSSRVCSSTIDYYWIIVRGLLIIISFIFCWKISHHFYCCYLIIIYNHLTTDIGNQRGEQNVCDIACMHLVYNSSLPLSLSLTRFVSGIVATFTIAGRFTVRSRSFWFRFIFLSGRQAHRLLR